MFAAKDGRDFRQKRRRFSMDFDFIRFPPAEGPPPGNNLMGKMMELLLSKSCSMVPQSLLESLFPVA